MQSISVHFSPELDFFLARHQRGQTLTVPVVDAPAIRQPVESLGVPHTEVGLILVNGRSVTFSERVRAGDIVFVFGHDVPHSPSSAVLRSPLASPPRFVLDTHLGRLARYLRLLGFDALYDNEYADQELAAIAAGQGRALLTRDRGLLKRRMVDHGYCLRTTDSNQQIVDVVRRFKLVTMLEPYTRCVACNGTLESVAKADVLHLLEPKTKRYYDVFKRCSMCGRIFWNGSHTARMNTFIERVRADAILTEYMP